MTIQYLQNRTYEAYQAFQSKAHEACQDLQNKTRNVYQKIGFISPSKRAIVAPINLVFPDFVESPSDIDMVLFHPTIQKDDSNTYYMSSHKNIYTTFRPIFQDCHPRLDDTQLSLNEKSSRDAIRTALISRSLLHQATAEKFADQFLQTCNDDPRRKVLYLVAQEKEENGFLYAIFNNQHLATFADQFDLRFKEVKTFKKICEIVSTTYGNIAAVVIQAHGTPEKGLLLSKDGETEERISGDKNYDQCFSKVSKDGTIVLIGGASGQKGGLKRNLAQRVADIAKRRVIAPTCLVDARKITVRSIDPLELDHPAHSFSYNLFTVWCRENNKNLFKVFEPKTEII